MSWARPYLTAIDRGELRADEMTLDQLGRFATLKTPELAAIVRKHWGVTRGATREERLAEVRRLNNDLRAADGDPARRTAALPRPLRHLSSTCSARARRSVPT